MKTYIPYGSDIKSKDIMEAISIPNGIGPILGFGSVDVSVFTGNSATVVLKSEPFTNSSDVVKNNIEDKSIYHGLSIIDKDYDTTKLISESVKQSKVKFGCITQDGYEYVSAKDTITVPIVNSGRGTFNEIMVFAYHDYINVSVENPVYFKAFWNRGSISFYDFYRNLYEEGNLNSFKGYSPKHTYKELVNQAETSRGGVANDGGVLIGVYGINPTDTSEYFSLVPYKGNIQSMGFDKSIVDYFDAYLESIKKFLGEFPSSIKTIREYIDGVTQKEAEEEPVGYVPIGGIIIWSKPEVPRGWSICDGTNGTPDLRGRFVYGSGATDDNGNSLPVGSTGGSKGTKLNINNLPAHSHGIPRKRYKAGDNADNRSMVQADGDDFSTVTATAGKEDPDPVSIIPPYMVLYYIMRIR